MITSKIDIKSFSSSSSFKVQLFKTFSKFIEQSMNFNDEKLEILNNVNGLLMDRAVVTP